MRIQKLISDCNIPVFSLPRLNCASSKVLAKPTAGPSPHLPAGRSVLPRNTVPRKNVPVVSTTHRAVIVEPSSEIKSFLHSSRNDVFSGEAHYILDKKIDAQYNIRKYSKLRISRSRVGRPKKIELRDNSSYTK